MMASRVLSRTASNLISQQVKKQTIASKPLKFLARSSTLLVEGESRPRNTRTLACAAAPTPSLGKALKDLASQVPEKDAVRYEHKNQKWSFKHVEFYADCLATGLVELGYKPGDRVLSWLPDHFSEQHILQFACSKSGLILYTLDPKQAITDKEGAKAALAKALEVTKANILITQEAGDDVHYARLVNDVIPETIIFDCSDMNPFFTPRFPHLRMIAQTGFEIGDNWGMECFKHLLVNSGELESLLGDVNLSGETPLYGELCIGSDGSPSTGKLLSNHEVVKAGVWPTVTSILKQEYTEVEGVGVIF